MTDFIRHISKVVLADGWKRFSEFTYELRNRDGSWQKQTREVYERGSAVTCLLRNPDTDHVLLTRQFRLPCHLIGRDAHLIEAPAGMLDGVDPVERMRLELEEETGFSVSKMTRLFDLISSPGGVDETVVYYVGEYRASDRVSDGGGVPDEGEDIEVLEIPLNDALHMITTGEIYDAKTVILLQHYALQR